MKIQITRIRMIFTKKIISRIINKGIINLIIILLAKNNKIIQITKMGMIFTKMIISLNINNFKVNINSIISSNEFRIERFK